MPGASPFDSELKLYRDPQRQRIFPPIFIHAMVLYSHLARETLKHFILPLPRSTSWLLSMGTRQKKKISTEHDGEVKKKEPKLHSTSARGMHDNLPTGLTIRSDRFGQSCPFDFCFPPFFPACATKELNISENTAHV